MESGKDVKETAAVELAVAMMQDCSVAGQTQSEDVVEVGRQLTGPPEEASTPSTTESRPTPGTHHQPDSDHSQTPVAAAPSRPPRHTATPAGDAVSPIRNLSDEEKDKRFIMAAMIGSVDEMRGLLTAGANVRVLDRNSTLTCTPLHYVACRGLVDGVRCLVENGAEVDARDSEQKTPMHWTASWGHAAVMRLLVSYSGDPNARDNQGRTPLHIAAQFGRVDGVAALLETGADRAARDAQGKTPLDLALEKSPEAIARKGNKQRVIQMLSKKLV